MFNKVHNVFIIMLLGISLNLAASDVLLARGGQGKNHQSQGRHGNGKHSGKNKNNRDYHGHKHDRNYWNNGYYVVPRKGRIWINTQADYNNNEEPTYYEDYIETEQFQDDTTNTSNTRH